MAAQRPSPSPTLSGRDSSRPQDADARSAAGEGRDSTPPAAAVGLTVSLAARLPMRGDELLRQAAQLLRIERQLARAVLPRPKSGHLGRAVTSTGPYARLEQAHPVALGVGERGVLADARGFHGLAQDRPSASTRSSFGFRGSFASCRSSSWRWRCSVPSCWFRSSRRVSSGWSRTRAVQDPGRGSAFRSAWARLRPFLSSRCSSPSLGRRGDTDWHLSSGLPASFSALRSCASIFAVCVARTVSRDRQRMHASRSACSLPQPSPR